MESGPWVLSYDDWDPKKETLREALTTVGNGYFATRGASEEFDADEATHYPGTYLAGGFNRLSSEVNGRDIWNEDFVNFPNWLCLNISFGDSTQTVDKMEIVSFRRELLLKEGVLFREIVVRNDKGNESRITSRRFIHMSKVHVGAIEYCITPLNWDGEFTVKSEIDGGLKNYGTPRYRALAAQHLEVVDKGSCDPEGVFCVVRTVQSRVEVAVAARTRIYRKADLVTPSAKIIKTAGRIGQEFTLRGEKGQTMRVEKTVTLYSSRDAGISAPKDDAVERIIDLPDFAHLLKSHMHTFNSLWKKFDVLLVPPEGKEGDAEYQRVQQILRIHIFHMLVTASSNTIGLDVSVPARGLHGESYRGHIFWDELFIFPFYTLRMPDITRTLLLYRFNRLDAAAKYAKQNGYRGAMFPWQSGSNGQEETQIIHFNPNSGKWDPDNSCRQRHVNLAIFYNVWQYYSMTGDLAFLEKYGAEMALQIAKFISSMAHINKETGRWEIHGVMGPDEYHESYPGAAPGDGGVRNNAYTNLLGVWCLKKAVDILNIISSERRDELTMLLELDETELDRWADQCKKMTVPFHSGHVSHFEGYEALGPFDWDTYRAKYGNIARLDRILKAEGSTPDHFMVSKQADFVQLFYLLPFEEIMDLFKDLGYDFSQDDIKKNVLYYLERTSHGSSLSNVVFASVLSKLHLHDNAWDYYWNVLKADVEDIQGGTSAEGIHTVPMAASVTMLIQQFTGMELSKQGVRFAPSLPPQIGGVVYKFLWGDSWLSIDCHSDRLTVSNAPVGNVVPITVNEHETIKLEPGASHEWTL